MVKITSYFCFVSSNDTACTLYTIGIGSYSGLMEDMYLYTQALTQRYISTNINFIHG